MTRPSTESSSTSPRENRAAKGRGRASAEQTTSNAIESTSLSRVDLPPQPGPTQIPVQVDPTPAEVQSAGESGDRREAIARAAYYRAEQRGFAPGYELEDWLEAERALLEKEGATDIR
jgi:hypothetical protein